MPKAKKGVAANAFLCYRSYVILVCHAL